MSKVIEPTGGKVIDAQDLMSFREETVGKMRAEKTGSAGDKNAGLQICACSEEDDLKMIDERAGSAARSALRRCLLSRLQSLFGCVVAFARGDGPFLVVRRDNYLVQTAFGVGLVGR